MKKVMTFLSLILVIGLTSCDSFFNTEDTSDKTYDTKDTPVVLTEEGSTVIDQEQLVQDVYDKIYADIYEEVKAEVSENVSEERFDEIYAEIVDDLIDEVVAGNIDIDSETIIDMINQVETTVSSSVIGVTALDEFDQQIAIGSGVIYKHVGDLYYVVTNNHVVEDGSAFQIQFEDGTTIDAALQGVDELVDLAVLYFSSTEDLTVASFADSDAVKQGDVVLAVGNPIGYDYYGSITMGIVSGLNRFFDVDSNGVNDLWVNYIQHDAAINNGNSGGALFDIDGNVIGINVIKLSATEIEGMGFAIPSNLVEAIVADIEEYGYSLQKPVLGINFIDIEGAEAYFAANGIIIPSGITNGFYVNSVVEGSSVDGYVLPGDIITNIGGIELTNSTDFVYEFSAFIVGDIISITLYRDGEYITIDNIVLKAMVED